MVSVVLMPQGNVSVVWFGNLPALQPVVYLVFIGTYAELSATSSTGF